MSGGKSAREPINMKENQQGIYSWNDFSLMDHRIHRCRTWTSPCSGPIALFRSNRNKMQSLSVGNQYSSPAVCTYPQSSEMAGEFLRVVVKTDVGELSFGLRITSREGDTILDWIRSDTVLGRMRGSTGIGGTKEYNFALNREQVDFLY